MSFFKKLDKVLERLEHRGFKFANTAHKFAVNCVLIFIVYNVYTIFRDYNRHFKEVRVKNNYDF